MGTTIDLPDELLTAAKKRAAELRCSLQELLERGLRHELSVAPATRPRRSRRIRWVTVRGGLPNRLRGRRGIRSIEGVANSGSARGKRARLGAADQAVEEAFRREVVGLVERHDVHVDVRDVEAGDEQAHL